VTIPALSTRPVAWQDEEFLWALFKTVRSAEFAHVPLSPAALDRILEVQYRGQKMSYESQYAGGHDIILLDGVPVGRIWLFRGAEERILVDISLLPAYRNRGIGGALIERAIAAARAAGVPLRSSVALSNTGSLRLHQRLGFRIAGQDDVYCDLVVEP